MGIQFVDPWKAIESLQVKLVNEKILFDLILVLNHGNAPDDISLLCDEKKGSRVDLILSGHDHYVSYCRYDNMYPARASKCSVHSGSNTEVIQKIDLEIDETKMRINNIKTCTFDLKRMIELNIANDSDVEDIEKMIRKNHQELDDEVVFCESVISKQKIRTLVERALAWHTNLEISYLTNGGIRSIFPQGVVTYEDVLTICPFDDLVCMVNIYGNEVNPDVVERLKVEHNINIECNERVYRIATNDYAIEQRVLFKNDKIAAIIRDEGRIECLDRVQVKFVFIEYLKKLRRISDIIDFVSFKTSFED